MTHTFDALGTHWTITLSDEDVASFEPLHTLVQQFQKDYSRFDTTSYVGVLNDTKVLHDAPVELIDMIVTSKRLFYETNGVFNITVGAKLEADGYGLISAKTQRIADDIDTAIMVDGTTITLTETTRIDLGGIGKGWLIDKLGRYLDEKNIRYTINGGGDIRVNNPSGDIVQLEHPLDPTLAIGSIDLTSGAIAASSPRKRVWKKGDASHSHIVDTKNTQSDITAVFVTARTTTIADTLATIFLLAPDSMRLLLATQYEAEYMIIREDGSFRRSASFAARLH